MEHYFPIYLHSSISILKDPWGITIHTNIPSKWCSVWGLCVQTGFHGPAETKVVQKPRVFFQRSVLKLCIYCFWILQTHAPSVHCTKKSIRDFALDHDLANGVCMVILARLTGFWVFYDFHLGYLESSKVFSSIKLHWC